AIVRGASVAPPTAAQRVNFRASIKSLATVSSEMHWAEMDAYSEVRTRAQIRADDFEEVALSYVLAGCLHAQYVDDTRQLLNAGDFFLTDLSRPSDFHGLGRHRIVQILLPRMLLNTVFSQQLPPSNHF